jgi:hypothetical protein
MHSAARQQQQLQQQQQSLPPTTVADPSTGLRNSGKLLTLRDFLQDCIESRPFDDDGRHESSGGTLVSESSDGSGSSLLDEKELLDDDASDCGHYDGQDRGIFELDLE